MIRLSVTSSSRYLPSKPLACNALATRAARFFSLNCRAETLTQTTIGGRPAFCQALFCRQASFSTQSPIGAISPVSSAIGMNFIGAMTPSLGWFHLTRASTAKTHPVRKSTCGW